MSVLLGYARTPFVRFNGAFAAVPATVLGAHAIRAALARAGIGAGDVDAVVGGQVLQAGAGQNPARQSAAGAGIGLEVPAVTVNSVCLSGMEAVVQAHRLVSAGEARVVVAVGQESMSRAPHLWPTARAGQPFGAAALLDSVETDALSDAFDGAAMGLGTDVANEALGLDRAAQDAWAERSHRLAAAAADLLAGEVVAVEVPGRRGATTVAHDDGVRPDTSLERLAALRPAFRPGGSVTAGNASQISDGAAAVVVADARFARERGPGALAEVVGHAVVAGPDTTLHSQPARAIARALQRAGLAVADLDAVEVNEAFAAVAVQSVRELGIEAARVNRHGGAIALGHPVGASGTRVTGHLARTLGPGRLGAAAICGGGGQGAAVLLRGL
ncbi:acetyl-CoA C-acyltransferase [Kineococcus rhizosphaerae]|uniref:Probable acetyl-CoA acetyltransferase n=1 Tax=Kineococcus rhizosphaerae TaxID=559628 RepID=A0A2T0RA41_9ACTN|nr:acetyl-CoA C-acyltransferase [Kineococcus rhizosphaerae]PRY18038.1 acetyl-CoA C-acetyltransferase [Kineococcus rhizosphaerae]